MVDPTMQNDLEKKKSKVRFGIKFWLEFEDKNILGSGWAKLLKRIEELELTGVSSLTKAAEDCGYSYKYAWNILKRIQKRTGFSPVETGKGGAGGGGWVKLNEWGHFLLGRYTSLLLELKEIEKKLENTLRLD
ncbi:MAG: winged helix-turn-helix domain-containing protein [Promethearchaeota archaeon]